MSGDLAQRFDGIYRGAADPWSYETSEYEAGKYRATLDALPHRPIRRALEMGCSIGVFTVMLAERCAEIVAADLSPLAVERARKRLAGRSSVRIEQRDLRKSLPEGEFDLVVCSEVLYYWNRSDVERVLDEIEDRLTWPGAIIAVNWRGADPAAPLDAAAVEAILDGRPSLERTHHAAADGYSLGRWERS